MYRRILSVVWIVFITLGLLEGTVRVFSAVAFPKMMVLDDELGWRHAQSRQKTYTNEFGQEIVIAMDQFGLRGADHALERTPGTYRILVLGDSFTEATEVADEDLFTSQLDVAGGEPLEVINTGVGGWSNLQEYIYLEGHGLQFEPDLVLLMFFENDYIDNCMSHSPGFGPRPHFVRVADRSEIRLELDATSFRRYILPIPFNSWLNRHSYTFNFVNNRIYQPLNATKLRELRRIESTEALQCADDAVDQLLGRFKALLDERTIDFAVALIPSRQTLAGRTWMDSLDPLAVEASVLGSCAVHATPCLPLRETFRLAENRDELYFPTNIHWTAAGHRAAADALSPFLSTVREAASTN